MPVQERKSSGETKSGGQLSNPDSPGRWQLTDVCVFAGGHYPFGGDVSDDRSFGHTGPSEPEQEYKPHPQRVYTSSITVNPPASFRPIPIQDQGPTPKPAPPAVPPKPFKDTSVFQNVDLHAVEVSLQSVILYTGKL